MSAMPDAGTWRQLGEMLRRSREDLDPRYAGRGGLTLFAEERGLNRRVAWDIENGKRDNYTRAMLRDIEGAYGLPRRAIDDFFAAAGSTAQPPADEFPDDDPVVQYVRSLPGLSPGRRKALEHVARTPNATLELRRGFVGWTLQVWQQQDQAENRSA